MSVRTMVLAAGLVVALGLPAATGDDGDRDAETYRLLNLFGDVFERVRADYVEETSDQELIEAAIGGMLTSLDPHSGYLNADSFRDMQVQTKGEFGGLGIEVTMENGLVKVVSPIDDTPAYRAGLEPGDLITHLDSEPVLGLTLADAVEKMRGRVGSTIKLTIRRDGRDPFDVALTRAVIKIRSVRHRLEGDVGYVRISSFSEQTAAGVTSAVTQLRETAGGKLQGIVLDLRNNPGGLLSQAVAVADAFLDQGEIVSTGSRRAEDTQRYNARSGDVAEGLPIVVLINTGSASASEIVAGALQDHGRAIILGTKSFGKGSVQTIVPLTGYGAIRLTTARYYTPSGRSIQAVGIDPDIEVEQARIESLDTQQRRREADLRGRLDNGEAGAEAVPPNNGDGRTEPGPANDDQRPQPGEPAGSDADGAGPDDGAAEASEADRQRRDYQLVRAIDLIRGIALYAARTAAPAN